MKAALAGIGSPVFQWEASDGGGLETLKSKWVKLAPKILGKDLKPENIDYRSGWLTYVDDKNSGIGPPGTHQQSPARP